MRSVLVPDAASLPQGAQSARAEPATGATQTTWPKRILVATHGGHNADHAITAAEALADRTGATVTVVTAYAPRVPVPSSVNAGRVGLRRCEGAYRPEAARLLHAVHEQQRRLLGKTELWPVHLGVGDPVRVILDAVHECEADLVVAGIGRPLPTERARGDQVPITVAHHLEIPLYAVAEGAAVPPQRVVLMLPDGLVVNETVRAAWACSAPDATFWVIVPSAGSRARRSGALSAAETRSAIVEAIRSFAPEAREPVVEVVDAGEDVLEATMTTARKVDAQLIAVPLCGSPGVVRALLPNLAWPLLLTTKRSVFVAPRGGLSHASEEESCEGR